MKASELIKSLQEYIDEYGDLEVIYEDDNGTHRGNVKYVLIESGAYGTNFKLTNFDYSNGLGD